MSGHRSTINDAANNRYTLLAEEGGGEAGNSSDNSGAEDKTPVNELVVRIAAKPGPKLPAAQQHGSAATNTPPSPWVRVDRARRGAQQNDMHQPSIMTSTGTRQSQRSDTSGYNIEYPSINESLAHPTTRSAQRTKANNRLIVRRNNKGVLLSDLTPGKIVHHLERRLCKGDPMSVKAPWNVVYDQGIAFVEKGRFWIVVERDNDKLKEVTIVTNNGTGLNGVDPSLRHSYYALEPYEAHAMTFRNGSPNPEVLQIERLSPSRRPGLTPLWKPTMMVNVDEIHERSVNEDGVHLVAELTAESLSVVTVVRSKAKVTSHFDTPECNKTYHPDDVAAIKTIDEFLPTPVKNKSYREALVVTSKALK
ncbi:hypothetical protein LTR09_008257 [Extremus antarcticus]|uniref:Uncharacterized protein n=1 Tax=Extremus antarcticus TaxID=702011 RepID=A0AAJ0DBC0_9PEZI|nr:hypothetical protein LTR09_008257 [Extremus antarcticus]